MHDGRHDGRHDGKHDGRIDGRYDARCDMVFLHLINTAFHILLCTIDLDILDDRITDMQFDKLAVTYIYIA